MKFCFAPVILLICSLAAGSADLELRSLAAIPEAEITALQITLDLVNNGPQNADHAACNVYVYSGGRLLFTQNRSLSPLAASASRIETLRVELPPGPVTSLKAEIYDSVEADVQPSNNVAQVNIKAPNLKKADLQILEAAVGASEQPGKLAIRIRLRNNGPDSVPASVLSVELSVFGNKVAASERKIGRLAAGEELENTVPLSLTKTISTTIGDCHVKWNFAGQDFSDPKIDDNSYLLTVPLTPKMPDLLPQGLLIDKRGNLAFSIVNKGNFRSGASVTAVYINGALIQRFNTPELQPGATKKYQYPGTKFSPDTQISIVSDFNADVEEASEVNNKVNFKSD